MTMRAVVLHKNGGPEELVPEIVPDPKPVPLDCVDGFNEAYYGRPERLLDPGARRANSAWGFVGPDVAQGYADHLAHALESGEWDRAHGGLRTRPTFDGSLVLVRARPAG